MNEACGTVTTCFGWWIYDSFGAEFWELREKFSKIGFYSICGGGLVKVWGRPVGWRWSRGVVQLHDVGFREVVTLMGARG